MKRWQTDMIAIGIGLLLLPVLMYGFAATSLLVRLAYPAYDPDVVGFDHVLHRH